MFDGDALTAEEVAEMLRVSKNSVYRLAQSGELASYRVGRKLRFTLRDVEAYTRSGMRSQKGAQTAQSPSTPSRTAGARPLPADSSREGMREMPRAFSLDGREPFVIAGNDLSGDIIAYALAAAGLPLSRAHVGSYTALVNLYAKQANAALVSKGCAKVAIGVERLAKELPLWFRVCTVVPPLVRQHLHNRTLERQGMRHRARSTPVVPFRFVSSQGKAVRHRVEMPKRRAPAHFPSLSRIYQ